MMIKREKHVDEAWKETAALDKERLIQMPAGNPGSLGSQSSLNSPQQEQSPAQSQEFSPSPTADQTQNHESSAPANVIEAIFLNYIAGLAYQAMIFLGDVPNPVTNLIDRNLEQAKFIIDTLAVLREKTKGNLSAKESNLLNSSIYELQMKFVDISQKELPI
jgi:hypothetical protein